MHSRRLPLDTAFPSSSSTRRIPSVPFALLKPWPGGLSVSRPRTEPAFRPNTDVLLVNLNINVLKEAFPWGNLKGTVVDVGGGSGKVSITLAEQFPALNFVVQDSADMHLAGQALLTHETKNRVSFMQHSFFEPQSVGNAAAYILRACALNWCDQDVVTMLRSLVPGLERCEPNTPLLINDLILPAQGSVTRDFERGLRQIDLIMLVSFGGKVRTRYEFEALLKQADDRYEVRSFRPEGLMGLLEVYLQR